MAKDRNNFSVLFLSQDIEKQFMFIRGVMILKNVTKERVKGKTLKKSQLTKMGIRL